MAISPEDLKNLPTKYKILIGIGLALLLLYFYYFFFLQAAIAKRNALTESLESLEQQINQRRVVARQIEQHKREIEELNENLRIALAKLPEKKDIPSLLSSLSGAAHTEKLDILLFQPLEPVSREFYAELPVRMNVRGQYREIAAFFDGVAGISRIVNVVDAVIRGPEQKEAGAPPLLDAECLIKTYMFLDMADEKPQKGS